MFLSNWDAQTSTFIVGIPQDCHFHPKDDEKCEKCQTGMVLLSAIRSFVRKEWQNLKYAEHLALPSTPKLFKIVMQHTNYLNTAYETIFGESVPSDANDQFSDDDFSEAERILGLSPDLFRQLMQAIKKEIELKRKHDEELAKPKKRTRRKKDAVEKTSKTGEEK